MNNCFLHNVQVGPREGEGGYNKGSRSEKKKTHNNKTPEKREGERNHMEQEEEIPQEMHTLAKVRRGHDRPQAGPPSGKSRDAKKGVGCSVYKRGRKNRKKNAKVQKRIIGGINKKGGRESSLIVLKR